VAPFQRRPDDRFRPLLRNALRLRCPVCKAGPIFPGFMTMTRTCPACSAGIEREHGYFLGSIYFNYGLTCILCAVLYFGMLLGLGMSRAVALWSAVAAAVLFPLWFWRYARSLWLMLDQYMDPRLPPPAPSEVR
jgi:uncharacterized protein (DUF983 family)